MRTAVLVFALALVAGCSIDSVKFITGNSDAAPDGVVIHDTPMIDTPAGPLTIVVSGSSLMVTEGQTKQLMVSLSQSPPGALLVTLESSDDTRLGITPTAVLFSPADWSVPQAVTVTGKQDSDVSDEAGTITLRSTAVASPLAVNVAIDDDDGLALALSAVMLDVGEGSTGSVAVHLTAQPVANVTVTVMSSNTTIATTSQAMLVFTPANWAIDQTITITGLQDVDTITNNATIDFTSTALANTSLAIQVTDDDVLGIATSTSSLPVTEGATRTFTVNLTQQPPANTMVTITPTSALVATVSPATLTFTTADYLTPQTVTVTAVNDDDVADGSTALTLASTGLASRSVVIDVTEDDVQEIIATPSPLLAVTEGSTSQLAISLAFRPSASVTMTVASLETAVATVSPTIVTFSTANFATPQMITIGGVQDADAVPNNTTIRVDAASLGLTRDITANVVEDDTLGIEVSATSIAVTEGATTTFQVRLTAQPAATTTVSLVSSDPSVTTAPTSLSFTTASWNVFQAVTVTGAQDANLVSEAATITASSTAVSDVVVNIAVTDNDTQAVVASPMVTVTEGASTSVGVTLAFVPATSVTVTVASANGAVATVTPTTLTFTPASYNTPQNITIAGTEDADALAGMTIVTLMASGASTAMVMVNVTDNDALNIDVTPTTLTIGEAGNGALGVRLTAMPAASVTVSVASSDAGAATVSPATLTFTTTNYATYQSVTVTGVDDADAGNETVTVTLTATGVPMASATVNVTDNDPQSIVATVTSLGLSEGGTGTFGVHLGAMPGATTTVTIASNDIGAASVSPATLMFTTANWNVDQTVTVTGVQDPDGANEAVMIGASSPGIPTTTILANVTDDDTQAVLVSAPAVTVSEGGSTNVNVTLAFQPTSNLVVTVASAIPAVAGVGPGTLTFTPSNYATAQVITIAGTEDPDAVMSSTSISLTAPGATAAAIGVSVIDNDTLGIDLAPPMLTFGEGGSGNLQVRLTAQPPTTTTVNIASSDTTAASVTPSVLSFTTSNWNIFQNVQVAGVDDADTANENVTITVSSTGLTPRTAAVTVLDNDVLGIFTNVGSVSLGEAGGGSFRVHLTAMPTATTTVTVANGDPSAVGVNPTMLTFTTANYATDQLVNVNGLQDPDVVSEMVPLTLSAPGLPSVVVTANVTDDDTQVILVSNTSVSVNEGASSGVNVSLAFQPAANVVVDVVSSNPAGVGVNPVSLVFTPGNYNLPQPVMITTVADSDFDFGSAFIRFTSPGLGTQNTNVTIIEPGIIAKGTFNPTAICEGEFTTFKVHLLGNPLGSLVVNITTDFRLTASVNQLTFDFANWSFDQAIDVSGDAAGTGTITVSAPGLTQKSSTVTVRAFGTPLCL